MKLSPMRFKHFIWPHTPRVYAITYERKMAENKLPFSRCALQNLGQTRRVFRGEGEFVGEGAYQSFKQLATVFYEDTPGPLIHPVWAATTAWFVGLELEQEPRSDYVRYSFEFWEALGSSGTGLTVRSVAGEDEELLHPGQTVPGSAGEDGEGSGPVPSGKPVRPDENGHTEVAFGPTAGEEQTKRWHAVVKGESLWSIAKLYDTTVDSLLVLNPDIRNPNLILVGQKVRVQ